MNDRIICMKILVIDEDEQILVICKPAGLVVQQAETVEGETLQDWMRERYREGWEKFMEAKDEVVEYFVERKGLVHRLDKETSGVMVLAKGPAVFADLILQFKEREVEKKYLGLTHGLWKSKEGTIRLPIGRTRYDRKKMGVKLHGRKSETSYKVLKEYKDWHFPEEVDDSFYQGFSLVEFRPKTGRTHQLRVHAKHLGHGVVGDYVYLGGKRRKEDRKWAETTMLHAKEIEFTHPETKKRARYECPAERIEDVLSKYF